MGVGCLLVWEPSATETVREPHGRQLRISWESRYPLRHQTRDAEARRVSGLDSELVREALYRAGYHCASGPRYGRVAAGSGPTGVSLSLAYE